MGMKVEQSLSGSHSMLSRDKQSYNIYDSFAVTKQSIINLELEQSLKVGPGDIIISMPELKAFLIIDGKDYDQRFETIRDER